MTRPAGLTLLDERSRPPLRERIGQLLASADEAAFAVARIRLAVLDLTDQEIGRVRRCRVLLGQLDASTLLDAADGPGPGGSAAAMSGLIRFARSGRLEVRSVGLGGWTPDFAVVTGPAGRTGVLGSIQFGNPELVIGPAFTAITADPSTAGRLLSRFDDLWERAHDVLPAILEVLERAHGLEAATAEERRDSDPA
jgi:hypothetical protein